MYIKNTPNGIIVTTKLHKIEEEEEEDDDDNNLGFEKLTGEYHPAGLLVFKIRKRLLQLIEKRKVRKFHSAS